jgi:L-ascorbate metabolism protein UlaG (beta-lactamase superfamily)
LHGDHFDRVARRELDHAVPIVTTPHAARRLSPRGFRTVGLPTWDRHQLTRDRYRLEIRSLPAVHAFGVLGRLLPPVMGSLLTLWSGETRVLTVYITGDTLLGEHLEAITERFPWIDTAVVHLGGTRVLGALVTLDGEGGAELLRRMAPAQAVPVHYDDYGVFKSPLSDFVSACTSAGLKPQTEVTLVERGQTVTLGPR